MPPSKSATILSQVLCKTYEISLPCDAIKAIGTDSSQFVTESCWGSIWTRPGLELKTRSFLNIAMLCCQNRGTELATHVKGALNNGGTEEEIREVILQAACYCGMPAGIEGFRVASKAVEEWKAEQVRKGQSQEADLDVGQRSAMET